MIVKWYACEECQRDTLSTEHCLCAVPARSEGKPTSCLLGSPHPIYHPEWYELDSIFIRGDQVLNISPKE